MIRYFLTMFGVSLGLTLLIELLLAVVFGVRKQDLIIVFLVNVLTNPAAVLVCYLARVYIPGLYLTVQIAAEVLVVITEGLIYRMFPVTSKRIRSPFMLSFLLNLISYLSGVVINYLV